MKRLARIHIVFLALLLPGVIAIAAEPTDIPDRPEKLDFGPLAYEPPDPGSMRHELSNGIPVYAVEDAQFPLITVRVLFRGGQYIEPDGKEGLVALTARTWRTGGAGSLSPQELDEELDFLAAQLSTSLSGVSGSLSLNLLSKDIDRGLELLMAVLLEPRFDEGRLARARDDLLAGMKQRNDDTPGIEGREWNRLLYGEDYWINRLPTKASVDSIQRSDLVDFHARLLHPKDVVVAVAGDFKFSEMLERLNATIGSIQTRGEIMPEIPQPTHQPAAGVYYVDKPDVNQGRVSIGHIGLRRPVEDEFEVIVADDILGGAGFTARMMKQIRSDEGLAYGAYSNYEINNSYPGTFRAAFQSKSATCARAAQLTMDIIRSIQTEGVSEDELSTSKNSFVQTFPNRFQSAIQTAGLYAGDELIGLSHDYWLNYRENLEAVTASGVQAAAARHIRPNNFVFLVVGNWEEIQAGHPDHPEIKFENFGEIRRIPLRDPMTLEPLE